MSSNERNVEETKGREWRTNLSVLRRLGIEVEFPTEVEEELFVGDEGLRKKKGGERCE